MIDSGHIRAHAVLCRIFNLFLERSLDEACVGLVESGCAVVRRADELSELLCPFAFSCPTHRNRSG